MIGFVVRGIDLNMHKSALRNPSKLTSDKGLNLKQDGLYRGKKLIACATENEIYEALGMGGSDRVRSAGRR
jgi:hypothetical protein